MATEYHFILYPRHGHTITWAGQFYNLHNETTYEGATKDDCISQAKQGLKEFLQHTNKAHIFINTDHTKPPFIPYNSSHHIIHLDDEDSTMNELLTQNFLTSSNTSISPQSQGTTFSTLRNAAPHLPLRITLTKSTHISTLLPHNAVTHIIPLSASNNAAEALKPYLTHLHDTTVLVLVPDTTLKDHDAQWISLLASLIPSSLVLLDNKNAYDHLSWPHIIE